MRTTDDHYEILGVEKSAAPEEIEASLWRLADRAMALQHTSPAESDALWLRVRRIRRDLLGGEERRRAYNAELLKSSVAGDVPVAGNVKIGSADIDPLVWFALASAEMSGTVPETAAESAIASRAVKPLPRTSRPRVTPRARARFRSGASDAGIAIVLMSLVAVLLIQPWNWRATASPARALALSAVGLHIGKAFVSGQPVYLHWSRAGKVAVYHLQVASTRSVVLPSAAFLDSQRTVLTTKTSYRLRVVGAQLYYWRVQALTGGVWHAYSRPRIFSVGRPRVASPVALRPTNGSVHRPGPVRLCWSRVSTAALYRVTVDRRRSLAVYGTCTTIIVAAGLHHWSLAAVVVAARSYTGEQSSVASFLVRRRKWRHVKALPARTFSSPATSPALPSRSGAVYLAPPVTLAAATSAPTRTISVSGRVSQNPVTTRHAGRRRRSVIPAPPPPPPAPTTLAVLRAPARSSRHVRTSGTTSATIVATAKPIPLPPPPPPVP